MSIAGLLSQVIQTSTVDKDYERRYNLICDADAAIIDASQTVESLIRLNTKLLAEILAVLASREHHGH